ncbi:MAG: CocE/NonD family hydrolase, partial [Actinomycetota bacterium]|nr:CocE/NonD family hydrolase [Actinomycetota bacterium]
AAAPAPPAASAAVPGPFSAHDSVNQVYVTGAGAGEEVSLLDAGGAAVATGTTDSAAAYLFRDVAAGTGFQVVRTSDSTTITGLTVTDPTDNPTDAHYTAEAAAHPLPAGGYGYLATRDGTTLSVNVTMPKDGSSGPWPVVINYSGYDPSTPNTTPQEAAVYPYQGYVVVGINMRGTGCSGGAFEFMETLQSLDGYDAVETIAHQSWSNGHVGMVGISYSGYSQLYVGATNPPHLDAITPLSPYSDTYSAILYPGGILNDGFAVDWATERENNAKPAARPWVRNQIANGDTTCADNQQLRLQSKPLLSRIHATPFADHEFDYLNTETFVNKIKMPTYLASQWQDEQTGGSAANLFALFDPHTTLFASFTNGTHVEPEAPSEIYESMVFIDLYVGRRIPHISPLLYLGAGTELAKLFGSTDGPKYTLPYNPWPQQPSYEAAKATYESQSRVRVKWENGSVPGREGEPFAPVVTRFAAWPPPQITAQKLYLQPDGALADQPSAVPDSSARASSSYIYDPDTKRGHSFDGKTDQMWVPHPDVHWNVLSEGNALSYLSAPYPKRAAYAGQGSVDLWLRSSAADTDLETTITEVRPDGHELLIQSGWLRASHRKTDPARSTELVPYQDHQRADAAPLPADQFTKVRVELFPFAHVFRPGSRLRLNIEAPGGNQPFWAFETLPGTSVNSIGHSAGMASRVVLPRLPDAEVPPVPDALPACELAGVTTQAVSLRGQPCRSYA